MFLSHSQQESKLLYCLLCSKTILKTQKTKKTNSKTLMFVDIERTIFPTKLLSRFERTQIKLFIYLFFSSLVNWDEIKDGRGMPLN